MGDRETAQTIPAVFAVAYKNRPKKKAPKNNYTIAKMLLFSFAVVCGIALATGDEEEDTGMYRFSLLRYMSSCWHALLIILFGTFSFFRCMCGELGQVLPGRTLPEHEERGVPMYSMPTTLCTGTRWYSMCTR